MKTLKTYNQLFESLGKDIVWGIFKDNPEMIMRGVDKGEDINIQNGVGVTALIFMAESLRNIWYFENHKNYAYLLKLIDLGADWNITNNLGETFIDKLNDVILTDIKERYPEKYEEYLIKKETDKFNI